MAREKAAGLRAPRVIAEHADITDARFDVAFFGRFGAVLNALDNVAARQHVNRLCMQAHVAVIESGTMGYNGQVQTIVRGAYECYDCRPRQAGRSSFAVCTIHARPTTIVHAVHFAKELYESLFGESSFLREARPLRGGDQDTLQPSSQEESRPGERKGTSFRDGKEGEARGTTQGGSGSGSLTMQPAEEEKGANFGYLREVLFSWWTSIASKANSPSLMNKDLAAMIDDMDALQLHHLGEHLLERIYHDKIKELLSMKSDWPTAPPIALEVPFIHDASASFTVADVKNTVRSSSYSFSDTRNAKDKDEPLPSSEVISRDSILTTTDSIRLFISACARCAYRVYYQTRRKAKEASSFSPTAANGDSESVFIGFSKNDDDAVDFVAAAANLRAHVFHISVESVEALRTIAGAIVPAIATTNAIVAAGAIGQLIKVLKASSSSEEEGGNLHDGKGENLEKKGRALGCQNVYVRKVPQIRRCRPGEEESQCQSSILDSYEAFLSSFRASVDEIDGSMAIRDRRDDNPEGISCLTRRYLVHTAEPCPPNPLCLVCQRQVPEVRVVLDLEHTTLGNFIGQIVENILEFESPSVACEGRLIYEDDDYEDLAASPLSRFARPKTNAAFPGNESLPIEGSLLNTLGCDGSRKDNSAEGRKDYIGGYAPLVMLVDGINKEVEWQVIVEQTCNLAENSANVTEASTTPALRFSLRGFEEAKACEVAALARLEEKKRDEIKNKEEEKTNGHVTSANFGLENAVDVDASQSGAVNTVNENSVDIVELD